MKIFCSKKGAFGFMDMIAQHLFQIVLVVGIFVALYAFVDRMAHEDIINPQYLTIDAGMSMVTLPIGQGNTELLFKRNTSKYGFTFMPGQVQVYALSKDAPLYVYSYVEDEDMKLQKTVHFKPKNKSVGARVEKIPVKFKFCKTNKLQVLEQDKKCNLLGVKLPKVNNIIINGEGAATAVVSNLVNSIKLKDVEVKEGGVASDKDLQITLAFDQQKSKVMINTPRNSLDSKQLAEVVKQNEKMKGLEIQIAESSKIKGFGLFIVMDPAAAIKVQKAIAEEVNNAYE